MADPLSPSAPPEVKPWVKPGETFSVVQFFPNGTHEYLERSVPPQAAVERFFEAQLTVGARIGAVHRLIITDADDFIAAEWVFGRGLTFPRPGTAA